MQRPYFRVLRDFTRLSPTWNQRRHPRTDCEAMIDLFSMAAYNHFDYVTRHGVDALEPGEFVASARFLAERWRWSKDAVTRFLKRMAREKWIARQ